MSKRTSASDRKIITKAERVAIKVGTNLLTDKQDGVNRSYINALAKAIAKLRRSGKKVVLISSGAIGAGLKPLGWTKRPRSVPDRQATAAVGQAELMHLYSLAFRKTKPSAVAAQLLLTRDGLENRQRYVNTKNTIEALWQRNAVPIVNENDTVAVEEICFGDNDLLSVLVANTADADVLILLTDVPGLLDESADNLSKPNPESVIPTVKKITPKIEALVRPQQSHLGTGGMHSKLEAAKVASASGLPLILADGKNPDIITDILRGKQIGTYFPTNNRRPTSRKRWLAFAGKPRGAIQVDKGAQTALAKRNKSLLPSGITRIEGRFSSAAVVALLGPDGTEFARGLSNYSSTEIEKIRGKKSEQIKTILGRDSGEEVIHRDDLLLI